MKLETALERYRGVQPWASPALTAFGEWVQGEEVASLEARMLAAFVEWLGERGYQPNTIRKYRAAVNGFFWWLLERGALSFSEAELVEALHHQGYVTPDRAREKIVGPDEEQVRALVRAAHDAVPPVAPHMRSARYRQLVYLRNVAMVEILRATGIRISELVALRRADVDSHNQTATAPDGRTLYFDLESWAALSRYLEARGDGVGYPLFQWNLPLFARHDPASVGRPLQPLHRAAVTRMITALSPTAGLGGSALRARFAHLVLAATEDEAGTAQLLGLRNPSSVRRYAPEEN